MFFRIAINMLLAVFLIESTTNAFQPTPSDSNQSVLLDIVEVLPSGFNSLTVIDYEALSQSQWAQEQGLDPGEVVGAPESASYLVLASNLNLGWFDPVDQIAFVKLESDTPFEDISGDGIRIDEIAERQVVWLNQRAAVLELGNGILTIQEPAGRQGLSRWIRSHLDQPTTDRASIYLRYAATQAARKQNLMVVAMDLRDAFTAVSAKQFVEDNGWIGDSERAQAIELLSSVEGVAVTVRATDQLQAAIEIRFEHDADVLQGKIIDLVDSLTRGIGARISSLEQWDANVDGKVVRLMGTIDMATLDNLFSIAILDTNMPRHLRHLARSMQPGPDVVIDLADKSDSNAETVTPDSGKSYAEIAEQREAKSTREFLELFRRNLMAAQLKTDDSLAQTRFWLDRYAYRLQYLDRTHVDPALLEVADDTTLQLRRMSEILEEALIDMASVDDAPVVTPTYDVVNYGGVLVRRGALYYGNTWWNEEGRLHAREQLDDAVSTVRTMGLNVAREFNAIGQQMAEKYGFEFERWTPGGLARE